MSSPSYYPPSDVSDGLPDKSESTSEGELPRQPTPPFSTLRPVYAGNPFSRQFRMENVRGLRLTPLEQSAPRRYIRIAMAVPYLHMECAIKQQVRDIHRATTAAFHKTIQHWPWLAGWFMAPNPEDPFKLCLAYEMNVTEYVANKLSEVTNPTGDSASTTNDGYLTEPSSLRKSLFLPDTDPQPGELMVPVSVQTNFVQGTIVLGFAFCETVFDNNSIQNFLRRFMRNTHCIDPRETICEKRTSPQILGTGVNFNFFPCYNWTNREIQAPTPREDLFRQVISFTSEAVVHFVNDVRDTMRAKRRKGLFVTEDCVLGLVWLLIMRARCKNRKIGPADVCRANYVMPGFNDTLFPSTGGDFRDYTGNASVTVVSQIGAVEFLTSPENPSTHRISERVNQYGVGLAAMALCRAQVGFKAKHLAHLGALKRDVPPGIEKAAYARALNRGTNGILIQNWTSFGENLEVSLPHATQRKPCFLPCWDDVEEGTVILLPRRNPLAAEDWHIYVCLDEQDHIGLTRELDREAWLLSEEC